jgi:hypothetical protein
MLESFILLDDCLVFLVKQQPTEREIAPYYTGTMALLPEEKLSYRGIAAMPGQ